MTGFKNTEGRITRRVKPLRYREASTKLCDRTQVIGALNAVRVIFGNLLFLDLLLVCNALLIALINT